MLHPDTAHRICDFCGVLQSGLNRCGGCGAAPVISTRLSEKPARDNKPHTRGASEYSHVSRTVSARKHSVSKVLSHKSGRMLIVSLAVLVAVFTAMQSRLNNDLSGNLQSPTLITPNHNGWYLPPTADR